MSLMKSIQDYIQEHRNKFDSKVWKAIDTLVISFSKLAHKIKSEELFWLLISISKDPEGHRKEWKYFADLLKEQMIECYNKQDFKSTMITAEKMLKVPIDIRYKYQTYAINYFAKCKIELDCGKLLQTQDWTFKLIELQTYRAKESLKPSRIQLVQELLQDKTIDVARKVFLLIELSWIKFSTEDFEAGLDVCRQAHIENLPENSIVKAALHIWTGKAMSLFRYYF